MARTLQSDARSCKHPRPSRLETRIERQDDHKRSDRCRRGSEPRSGPGELGGLWVSCDQPGQYEWACENPITYVWIFDPRLRLIALLRDVSRFVPVDVPNGILRVGYSAYTMRSGVMSIGLFESRPTVTIEDETR